MKKKFIPALTAALIVTSTSFAAPSDNPFSDVPEGHWAYQAVIDLTEAGIIEGYGDGTFRGNRNITRYEMAQMIARALAKLPTATVEIDNGRIDDIEGRIDDAESRIDDVDTRMNFIEGKVYDANTEIENLGSNSGNSGLTQAQQRELLNKLKAEFAPELKRLGVLEDRVDDLDGRVGELERNADFVKWQGKIEYTYSNTRVDPEKTGHKTKDMSSEAKFILEPSAEVSDHWTANAKFEAVANIREDSTVDTELTRIWAEGDYDKFNVKIGRMEFFTNENGLIWDTEMSGAQLTFGSKWKIMALGGRVKADVVGGGVWGENDSEDKPSDVYGANLQYENEKGLYGGAGWYSIKDDDFKTENYTKSGETDKANIWSANLGYAFDDNWKISGAYARNTKADFEKYSWQAQVEYGTYDDNPEKGDWSVWSGYRRYGTNVSFSPTDEDALRGAKGWFIDAAYAPFKNVGLIAKYFNGKYVTDGGDAKQIWGRIEYFF